MTTNHEELRLDKRFDDLVNLVRPYAIALNSDNLWLCRSWLDRLNKADNQRNLRNEYLNELYKQLKRGVEHMGPPFHKLPETGKLMPLSKLHRMMLNSSCNELTETSRDSPCEPHNRPRHNYSWPMKNRPGSLATKGLNQQQSRRRSYIPKRCDSSSPARQKLQCPDDNTQSLFSEQDERNQLMMYQKRIETLSAIVNELGDYNEKLRQKLDSYDCSSNGIGEQQLKARINQLSAEIVTLKTELSKVHEIKEHLSKKHNEIVDELRVQMSEQLNAMKIKVESAQGENKELRDKIADAETRLQKLAAYNEMVVKSSEDEWSEKLESMRAHYEKMLLEKEKETKQRDELVRQMEEELSKRLSEIEELTEKMNELQRGLESKSQEDGKLQTMLLDQYNAIKEELSQMRSNIESTSLKQNENYHQQITVLMKNVEKLKSHTRKLKDDYNQKIYLIMKKNEQVVSDLKIKLKANKDVDNSSQLWTSITADKYGETTDTEAGFKLDGRSCKKLLENLVRSADNQRSKYYEKLSLLDSKIGCHQHHH